MLAPTNHTEGLQTDLEMSLEGYLLTNTFNGKVSPFFHGLTFLYELPPTFSPFCELLRVRLFNTCTLMKTSHEVTTKPVTIVDPFNCSFVVTDLKSDDIKKQKKNTRNIAALIFVFLKPVVHLYAGNKRMLH